MESKTVIRYSHQTFRPEAVEAYATRQAGEAWDARHALECWIIAGLSIIAVTGLVFIIVGAH